jgi:hypothetical protein
MQLNVQSLPNEAVWQPYNNDEQEYATDQHQERCNKPAMFLIERNVRL